MPGEAVASAATSPYFRAPTLPAGVPDAARPARDPGNRRVLRNPVPHLDEFRRPLAQALAERLVAALLSYRSLVGDRLVLDRLRSVREPFRQRQLA